MGGALRKPIAVDSLQSLHEEANRLLSSFLGLIDYTNAMGGTVTNSIHQRYGILHNQILQIHRILKPMIEKEKEGRWMLWFGIWHQDIINLEIKYHSLRRAGLTTIQELEEPMLS